MLHEYYFTFWYMQDLIVLSFVFVWLLALCLKFKGLILLEFTVAIAMVVTDFTLPFMCKSYALLCFSIGAVYGAYGRRFFELKRSRKVAGISAVLLITCCVIRYFEVPVVSEILLYAFCPMLLWMAVDLIKIGKPKWFQKQTFFIYAAHVIPVTIVGHVLTKISTGSLWAAAAYIIAIAVTVVVIWIVSKFLNKCLPRFYSLVCGGRR